MLVSSQTNIQISPVQSTPSTTHIEAKANPVAKSATVDLVVSNGTDLNQSEVQSSCAGSSVDEAILLATDDEDVEGTPIPSATLLRDCTEEVLAGLAEFDEL